MSKVVLTLLLLLVVGSTQNTQDFLLSPSIPPVAFLGQYYTCDFRVTGLTSPQYAFLNLPRFFKGSPSGRIEGTPTEKGTFTITVSYRSGKVNSQKSVVLRVSDSNSSSSSQNLSTISPQNLNNIALIPSIFSQGEQIFINLTNYVPGSKTWIFDRLPIDLQGTNDGCIRGRINNKGLYTFGAVSSDNGGSSINYIFTLNIQPSYYNPYIDYPSFSNYNYQEQSQLMDVPIRNTCQCQGIIIEDLQYNARKAVQRAQKDVEDLSLRVSDLKAHVQKIISEAAMAQKTLAMATILRDRLLAQQAKAMLKSKDAKDMFTKVNNTYELYVTNYNQHLRAVKTAEYNVLCAEQELQAKRRILDKANEVFITAQSESAAVCAQIEKLQFNITSGKHDVADMFELVKKAKQNLLKVQGSSSNQDMDIENLKTERDIANMQNDIAISQFHTRDSILQKALGELRRANSEVYDLQSSKDQAAKELGKANFNLNQAMNNLLVAQAAKEQADKAIALASAEIVKRPQGTSTYIFSGCEIGAYPSYVGSAKIMKLYPQRAQLQSGQVVLFGECTQMDAVSEGDLVHFSGYFKSGCVQAVSLHK